MWLVGMLSTFVGLTSSSLLIECLVTHACLAFNVLTASTAGLSGSVAMFGMGVPTVLGTVPKLATGSHRVGLQGLFYLTTY